MWIYTRDGFASVRASATSPDNVVLRFRTAKHAQAFADKLSEPRRILVSEDTDYRYRFEASRRELASLMAREIELLDYPNFKAAAEETQDASYVTMLHEAWLAHYKMQLRETPSHES